MHKCPECQKEFPRPSGLRTHMNMHTKEKPYACAYPGCTRAFSVVSNAKRHMRTHGLGVTADDTEHPSAPYVVGFEEPVVIAQPEVETSAVSGRSQPFRLRWISLGSDSRLSNTNKVSVSPS
ncbi:hypothetical protein CPC08DRAFT_175419 [Agrocybe pediades]|nr:hypothetical protein CPC08DRAFT_175419 [Agrocybe pediades]